MKHVIELTGLRPDGSEYGIGVPSETITLVTATSHPVKGAATNVATKKMPGGFVVKDSVEKIVADMNEPAALLKERLDTLLHRCAILIGHVSELSEDVNGFKLE